MYQVILGLASEADGKEIARDCLAQYDGAVARGVGEKIHRVGHRFLRPGNMLRVCFEIYASTDIPLGSLPLLVVELFGYAACPVVCRRIEAVHSVVRRMQRATTNERVAALAAKLRRNDVLAALRSGTGFRQYLKVMWRKRLVMRRALSHMFSDHRLANMSMREWLGWFYFVSSQSQFQDRAATKDAHKCLDRQLAIHRKQPNEHRGDGLRLLISFLKMKFHECPGVWTVDRQVLFGEAAQDGGEHASMWQVDQGLSAQRAVACLTTESGVALLGSDRLVAFSVLNAFPERSKVVRPSYEVSDSDCMEVQLHKVRCVIDGGIECELGGEPSKVRLTAFADPECWASFTLWLQVERRIVGIGIPPNAQEALRRHLSLQALPPAVETSDGALLPHSLGDLAEEHTAFLHDLVVQEAIAERSKYVTLTGALKYQWHTPPLSICDAVKVRL